MNHFPPKAFLSVGHEGLYRARTALKPEGLAVAADGTHLVVVFDTDRAAPRWQRLELPK